MKPGYITTIIVIMLMTSCNKPVTIDAFKNNIYKDTVVVIDSLGFIDTKGSSEMTDTMAKKTLDDYYAPKDIFNLENGIQDRDNIKICAYYDTVYHYDLNNDHHEDGIIAYHLMPCGASGHCWQPTYAIITKIKGNYKLISAGFVPEGFLIDSVSSHKQKTYLYFFRFDCSENKVVRHYRGRVVTN